VPTLTVDLAKTYSLSLKEGKATRVDWGGIGGKNKLRRFFVHPSWQDYIAQVSVSSAGAKGGVFFLEAYMVTPEAFLQQMQLLGVNVNASGAWRGLHADDHLAGGLVGYREVESLGTQALPAVVHPRVMQGITLANNMSYGNDPAARANLLTALQNAAQLKKRYVVKGTNEPGRTLFAEYVLNTIGKAKIPKSLVLEIDPSRPHTHATDPSEGMIMLNLINTRRNGGADAARYDAAYANLHHDAQSVVDYLVVQKVLAGEMLPDPLELNGRVIEFLCDQKIIIHDWSFPADARFDGVSSDNLVKLLKELRMKQCVSSISGLVDPDYRDILNRKGLQALTEKRSDVEAVLDEALSTLAKNQLQRQHYHKGHAAQFDQLVDDLRDQDTALAQALTGFLDTLRPVIATNERILSDERMMHNTARVHFADALLGNGDRFHQFNTGNMFYVTREAKLGTNKASNPVGCIDNDSFLYTYLPAPGPTDPATSGFQNAKDYVTQVLKPDYELWGWIDPEPLMTFAPNMSLVAVLEYDNWFESKYGFFKRFIRDDFPVAVLDLYSDDFFQRGNPNIQGLPGWTRVRQYLREGVAHTLARYLLTDNKDFEAVYRALTERYYPGPNFEFTAFEIRDRYLRNCKVDQQNWTVLPPDEAQFKKLQADIVNWLIKDGRVNPECDNPQVSPIANRALLAEPGLRQVLQPGEKPDEGNIRKLLLTMAVSDQERILPNPFGSGPIPILFGAPRITFDAKWAGLKQKYQDRMNVVICTLLKKFWNEYIAEVGYLTHDRRRILGSNAFKAAEALNIQVSSLQLAKDEGKTLKNRQRILGTQLSLAKYVTAP
jgi:hypothetical protein